jgi:hypothetical protein
VGIIWAIRRRRYANIVILPRLGAVVLP